jgi:Rrf2 family transcriptional regulator, iron-sulfur cluster assembly transcription factor
MLSVTWQYTVRVLIHLSHKRERGPILSSEISEAEGIPQAFLSKILHTCRNAGLVVAVRGKKGGYMLVRDPAKITLLSIAHLIDHVDFGQQCLLGYKSCDCTSNCLLHSQWEEIKKDISEFLKTTTIDKLSHDEIRSNLDISEMIHSKQPPLKPPYKVYVAP